VLDRGRSVSFAKEACPKVGPDRKVGMEQLDRKLVAVAVRRRIDGRHAADAKHAIEAILVPKDQAEAGVRGAGDLFVCRRILFNPA
jgi:hypothetical protein